MSLSQVILYIIGIILAINFNFATVYILVKILRGTPRYIWVYLGIIAVVVLTVPQGYSAVGAAKLSLLSGAGLAIFANALFQRVLSLVPGLMAMIAIFAVDVVLLQGLLAIIHRSPALHKFFFGTRGDSIYKRLNIHLVLIFSCLIAVYPVLRIFTISLRPGDRLLSTDLAIIPKDAALDSYREVLFGNPEKRRASDFFLWLWNSLAITATTAIIGVILSATAGYAFSRFRFPGRTPGLIFLLTTQMIPAGMLLLPLYIMLTRLNLINTYLGLVIAYSVTAVPFSIWILKGYYDTIPIDLEEAARVDGCNVLGAFYRIILPLSTPALAIVFLFNFMSAWSEYMVARVVLQKGPMYTWPLGLWTYAGQYTLAAGRFAAASILVAVPAMALFLYSSKWLITGLTLGSVKG